MSFEFIANDLAERATRDLYREQALIEKQDGIRIQIAGRWYYNFASNDYLGIGQQQALRQHVIDAVEVAAPGSGASPLVTGYTASHQRLQDHLAQLLNRDRVLLFNSGFSANHAVIQALMRHGGVVLADRLSHASMLDGALASKARLKRFSHNDTQHLSRLLTRAQQSEDVLVLSEGVFSMDGDQAPSKDLAKMCNQHGAMLMLDDAHGFGVLGEQGGGTAQAHQLTQTALPLLMATFGKAAATSGAFIATNTQIYDYLVNFARHYIYSTAMSPLMAEITLASLKLLNKEQWRRDRLNENIRLFRQLSTACGLPVSDSETAIQPVIIGPSDKTMAVAEYIKNEGFWVGAIRTPTVAEGSARLRVTLTTAHDAKTIRLLVSAIEKGMTHVQ
ncbi:8-amino-7-oxononanoate synthase [Lacimicrobium sp. SS2-24]|uniref:aminotransferase class I/II-fold pyridoxal phosphate-dependent enzyme n=1 Tax=Lacimicrobium sp. SS2-24 TaxID=2005569 RepID=UPI000B4BC23E|nr:8-amino-7-oxononanoate synthase [Lacimicrobium sp. SS2-24]